MPEKIWNRREFIGGAALLALAIGVPIAGVKLSHFDERDQPTDRQHTMMRQVSQSVLPATDTPGAGDAAVGEFVLLALAHGLDGTREPVSSAELPWAVPEYKRQDGSLRYAYWLERQLDKYANGDFVGKAAPERDAIVAQLDREAYAQQGDHPWKAIKSLILTGYYTSEIGGSQELQFELVPGRYDPSVPIGPNARAYSSDWTAVDFG